MKIKYTSGYKMKTNLSILNFDELLEEYKSMDFPSDHYLIASFRLYINVKKPNKVNFRTGGDMDNQVKFAYSLFLEMIEKELRQDQDETNRLVKYILTDIERKDFKAILLSEILNLE